DSDTILNLKHLPQRMIVVGGGVVGCEYACLLQALGIEVTLLDRDASLLPFIDDEIAALLQDQMLAAGMDLRLNARAVRYDAVPGGVSVTLEDGTEVGGEALLFTGGRVGNTDGLNLDRAGIEVDAKG